MEDGAWNDNSYQILHNNKDAYLVLRSFKRIQLNMKHEGEIYNKCKEFQVKVHLVLKSLFADEGSEFMDVFETYYQEYNICLTVFKASTESKCRLAIVE